MRLTDKLVLNLTLESAGGGAGSKCKNISEI